MKEQLIAIITPAWYDLRDSDGLPDFPQPNNDNEMCLIDRARYREYLKGVRAERFCRWFVFGAFVAGSTFSWLMLR